MGQIEILKLLYEQHVKDNYSHMSVDAPDAPSRPHVDDVDKDEVTLSWSPPTRDGGAKLTGYVVEKKKLGDDDWSKAATLSPSDTSATIRDLEPNADYEFRVRAVNAAGPGEASLPSDLCKMVPKRSRSLCHLHHHYHHLLLFFSSLCANPDFDVYCN